MIAYFANHIKYERVKILEIESMWFKIFPFLLCFVYRPCYDDFENEVINALVDNPNTIILGDLNIDFLKPLPSRWNSFMKTYGFYQMINNPTRVTSSTITLIDHIYTTFPDNVIVAFLK